ncbi:peptidoglycan DD-metalloendopeptidase family protein [Rhodospirillaceae bacterium SYSU D60014]|uniref:M23 family metallopeptidase n=1 Tax=Virgifigura deserti TaxID=2268457 RepID=UPI0013C4EDD1
MSAFVRPAMTGGLLEVWDERLRVPPLAPKVDLFQISEDDLLPQSVINLYREQLDEDELDFLKRGPRSPAEHLAFVQRVHPAAHQTAEPASEPEQRLFRERRMLDEHSTLVGPDGIVYRRGEDSGEGLAARIRRGLENAVGSYKRLELTSVLRQGAPSIADSTSMNTAEVEDLHKSENGQTHPIRGVTQNEAGPPSLISPVPDGRVRGNDTFGEGRFGARRDGGKRQHQGVDIIAEPAATVVSAVSGTVTKIGYPYGDDLSYRYVEVTTEDGYVVRHFYVSPADGLKVGDRVEAGRTQIGVSQDLGTRYEGITNHIHIEVRDPSGRVIDPTPWLEGMQAPELVDSEIILP